MPQWAFLCIRRTPLKSLSGSETDYSLRNVINVDVEHPSNPSQGRKQINQATKLTINLVEHPSNPSQGRKPTLRIERVAVWDGVEHPSNPSQGRKRIERDIHHRKFYGRTPFQSLSGSETLMSW